MNWIIIIAVTLLAMSLAFALYRIALGSSAPLRDTSNPKSLIEPLDVLAFNNLIDPLEEHFLRENLPPRIFRGIQRQRLRAAIDYVGCAARNAAPLIKAGRLAGTGMDAEGSRQAHEIVTAAIHLRLLSALVLCLLWAKIAFPGLHISLAGISNLHEGLVRQLGALTRAKSLTISDHLPETSSAILR